MSTCISRWGEFGGHMVGIGTFVCDRCGVEDWDEAMAHIARLSERLDLAITMHGVQYERANRMSDELDRMVGALADMTHEVNDLRTAHLEVDSPADNPEHGPESEAS